MHRAFIKIFNNVYNAINLILYFLIHKIVVVPMVSSQTIKVGVISAKYNTVYHAVTVNNIVNSVNNLLYLRMEHVYALLVIMKINNLVKNAKLLVVRVVIQH